MSDDPRLLDLVAAVSDGERVDWDGELARAPGDDRRAVVRSLRLLADIAGAHRGGESPDAASPMDAEDRTVDSGSLSPGAARSESPVLHRWGQLEILEKVGQGAFGEVFRARDSRLDREVALKLLGSEESSRARVASSVIEEGRLLARVRHANVATVFGADQHEARVGIWMEFIHGRTLADLLREQGHLGAREASLIGIDLCRALTAVHKAGVVHRDVKAQNVMREAGGRIVLTDFGAGYQALEQGGEAARNVSGTPLYMAPETLEQGVATPRSDIYSLGVLLFHLVTGSFPVEGGSMKELVDKHRRGEARLLRELRPELPEGFVHAVERALATNPEERYPSAGQMERALASALGMEPAPAPERKTGPGRLALPLGVVGVLAGAAVTLWLLLAPTGSRAPAPDRKSAPDSVGTSSPGAAVVAPPYTVEAALYRVGAKSERRERLEPGAHLALGDRLTLDFQASAPLHVYVIDEDDEGHAYALFPLAGLDLQNPLSGGTSHVLPGSRNGKELSWSVDSPGGREHVMVLASPTRLIAFEAEMNALARPGQNAVPIPETAKRHLRGIGGLEQSPAAQQGASAGRLFEMAQRIASGSEVTRGVWMRRIELENPRPQ